jgi:prepilin-type N-terminal cleavage/methylation domain-containing protein
MLKSMLAHLRETSMRESEGEEAAEAGFTLIELMVVLLIIAILLAIAIPTFLGVANSAGDRAAQSNLTNALTEAKALYQNAATYSPSGTAMLPATFSASAPEFSWTQGAAAAGGCDATHANCVSEQVVDAGALVDGQGVILAAYSPKTQSCWYALDLESTSVALVSDTGVPFQTAAITPTGAGTAGVFYAVKKSVSGNAVTATNCNANWAATRGTGVNAFNWGLSYSSPGTAA